MTPGKTLHDVLNLMDSLGTEIDTTRDAIFVFLPEFADAAAAIRRCYPAAVLLREPSSDPDTPVLALYVPQAAVVAGRDCAAPTERGLRARYFRGPAWDGEVLRERIEDWPLRFRHDERPFGSVEWSGVLHVPVTGDYAFQLQTVAAAGDARVGDDLTLSAAGFTGARFTAGDYPITIRCRPDAVESYCQLLWRPPGGALAVISTERLRPQ
jgi:hypothetical protein